MTQRIFIVEDEGDLAALLELNLRDLAAEVCVFHTATAALDAACGGMPDLVVLDRMLPDGDGVELCRKLRAMPATDVAILMLTARSATEDRVIGLDAGADDYLAKPFKIAELRARIGALVRRTRQAAPAAVVGEILLRGALRIDIANRAAVLHGRRIALTAREFDLLVLFARWPGRVHTRDQLLRAVWGAAYEGYGHTVNSLINRLRAKIEPEPQRPQVIVTVWGEGYMFCSPEPQAC